MGKGLRFLDLPLIVELSIFVQGYLGLSSIKNNFSQKKLRSAFECRRSFFFETNTFAPFLSSYLLLSSVFHMTGHLIVRIRFPLYQSVSISSSSISSCLPVFFCFHPLRSLRITVLRPVYLDKNFPVFLFEDVFILKKHFFQKLLLLSSDPTHRIYEASNPTTFRFCRHIRQTIVCQCSVRYHDCFILHRQLCVKHLVFLLPYPHFYCVFEDTITYHGKWFNKATPGCRPPDWTKSPACQMKSHAGGCKTAS